MFNDIVVVVGHIVDEVDTEEKEEGTLLAMMITYRSGSGDIQN